MRKSWLLAVSIVAAACGGGSVLGDKAYDKNHDGLVGQCEGLNQGACASTSGCRGEQLACDASCQSDGNGGCLPCDSFACVPTTPPLPPSCESLPTSSCSADPRCELVTADIASDQRAAPTDCVAVCQDNGDGGCVNPCWAPPPPAQQFCVTKQVSGCEAIPAVLCRFVSACELQTRTVCTDWATGQAVDAGSPNEAPEFRPAPKAPDQDPPKGGCGGGGGGGGGSCTSYQVCAPRTVPVPVPNCGAIANPSDASCASVPGCAYDSCGSACGDLAPGEACIAVCVERCVPATFGGGSNGSPPQGK